VQASVVVSSTNTKNYQQRLSQARRTSVSSTHGILTLCDTGNMTLEIENFYPERARVGL